MPGVPEGCSTREILTEKNTANIAAKRTIKKFKN